MLLIIALVVALCAGTVGAQITATGGDATNAVNEDLVHIFTSSGTFTVTGSGEVEVLVVAGGGGGGIGWSGLDTVDAAVTSAWARATVSTNLDTCVLVWDEEQGQTP